MEKQNKGVDNTHNQFETIVNHVVDIGALWQPTAPHLSVKNLWALHGTIKPMLDSYDAVELSHSQIAGNRANKFIYLDGIAKRVYAIADSCGMAPEVVTAVKTYKDLIDGTNIAQAKAKIKAHNKKNEKLAKAGKPTIELKKTRPVAEQSSALKLQNFGFLIKELDNAGNYNTNEEGVTLAELKALWQELDTANKTVAAAKKALDKKHTERNALIVGEKDSVLAAVKDIKKHLRGMKNGKDLPEYKRIVAVKFPSLKKK
jgi:hypothetical protein